MKNAEWYRDRANHDDALRVVDELASNLGNHARRSLVPGHDQPKVRKQLCPLGVRQFQTSFVRIDPYPKENAELTHWDVLVPPLEVQLCQELVHKRLPLASELRVGHALFATIEEDSTQPVPSEEKPEN